MGNANKQTAVQKATARIKHELFFSNDEAVEQIDAAIRRFNASQQSGELQEAYALATGDQIEGYDLAPPSDSIEALGYLTLRDSLDALFARFSAIRHRLHAERQLGQAIIETYCTEMPGAEGVAADEGKIYEKFDKACADENFVRHRQRIIRHHRAAQKGRTPSS